jgi:UDP-N-acetylmuramyl pentapeptide phosphotransferase/UDP-N-acetylglucosamine-1-phosphate transferase
MNSYRTHPFWGFHSPLATLSGGSLLVLASVRFSFALVCAFALLWVYVLTGLALRIPFLPRRGRRGIVPFLASFAGGLYILLLFLVSPLLAMDTLFFLILCPLCCISSGFPDRLEKLDAGETLVQSYTEALVLSALILGLALIREPLGYGCLSAPGIQRGIVNFIEFPQDTPLPVRVIAASSGALFLLGYGIALFRRFRGSSSSPADGGGKP